LAQRSRSRSSGVGPGAKGTAQLHGPALIVSS